MLVDGQGHVSILAPAGGATVAAQELRLVHPVSILAPAGGATRPAERLEIIELVSILAPAGGATVSLYLIVKERVIGPVARTWVCRR